MKVTTNCSHAAHTDPASERRGTCSAAPAAWALLPGGDPSTITSLPAGLWQVHCSLLHLPGCRALLARTLRKLARASLGPVTTGSHRVYMAWTQSTCTVASGTAAAPSLCGRPHRHCQLRADRDPGPVPAPAAGTQLVTLRAEAGQPGNCPRKTRPRRPLRGVHSVSTDRNRNCFQQLDAGQKRPSSERDFLDNHI